MDRTRITKAQEHLHEAERLIQEHLIRENGNSRTYLSVWLQHLQGLQGQLLAITPGYELDAEIFAQWRKEVFPQTDAEKDEQLDRYYRTGKT